MPRPRRARLWTIAVLAATIVVAALLVLIALGILVLSAPATPTVTVTGVEWHIDQGTTSRGIGWFGPSEINTTPYDGFPVSIASGHTFNVVLKLSDLDSVNHSIYSLIVGAPFTFSSSSPRLPALVSSGEDDWSMVVTVTVPTVSSSETLGVNVTVDAFSSG